VVRAEPGGGVGARDGAEGRAGVTNLAPRYDAVVVGAGPNGLAAAITVARAGRSVLVLEAEDTIGGGARTAALTLPGFAHDVCSAIHPLARLSPFFRELPLERHGLAFVDPPFALAHPQADGSVAVLERDLEATCARFGEDGIMWRAMHAARLRDPLAFFDEILRPIRIPRRPLAMARFGLSALGSASGVAKRWFRTEAVRALFAGCAAHAMMPLDRLGTASFGLVLGLSAHAAGWPIPVGGSIAIVRALAAHLAELGGEIRTGVRVTSLRQLPDSDVVLFDVMPRQVADIAAEALPSSYVDALRRYRHGPGVFKIDWALDGPIPWRNPECGHAGTVHIGPRLADIEASEAAVWNGRVTESPFVLLAQQSRFDPTRAPEGKHTGWAYCHVPHGSEFDMTEGIEEQVERVAPGFRARILARHVMTARDVESHDAGFVGGDIGGGANDLLQVLARPVARWNTYTTPNPRLFLASSATPPGGGVHGMCGHLAARSALARLASEKTKAPSRPLPAGAVIR